MDMAQRLELLEQLISLRQNIYLWHYSPQMELLRTNCPQKNVYSNIIIQSDCKEQILTHAGQSAIPLIINDPFGILWSCAFAHDHQGLAAIYLIGPVFTNESTPQIMAQAMEHNQVPMMYKRTLKSCLEEVPVISAQLHTEYALMLHYCVNKKRILFSDMIYATRRTIADQAMEETPSKASHHGIYAREQILLQMVEEGNSSWQIPLSLSSNLSTGVKIQSRHPLRQAQDSVITFIALCTRAAIRGGLSSEKAYDMNDMYVQNVEQCQSLPEVLSVSHQMYSDFIRCVQKVRERKDVSPPVKACLQYIDQHITEKIELKEMAAKIGYADYYLSKRFKQETKQSVNSYVLERKIAYAKILLSTTNKSIADISADLAFSSRSYFTDCFVKTTGETPIVFRKKNQTF